MHAPKSCFVKDWRLFKAVVNGRLINLESGKKKVESFVMSGEGDNGMIVYK
jgi:hypothetical protein